MHDDEMGAPVADAPGREEGVGGAERASASRPSRLRLPLTITGGVAAILLLGGFMLRHAEHGQNQVALSGDPKGVTTVAARGATWRATRQYIGTVEPWVEARLGPQYLSAYVDTVLVRPGAAVKRGQVLASLDCRNASAATKALAMQARALQTTQEALTHEAARVSGLLKGGFVSPNEAEVKTAASESKQAELLAARAQLMKASLEVNDCVIRAPFDGEVADRRVDPGAFVRPGSTMLAVVDRQTVRVTADVPESDVAAVAPGTAVEIRLLANGRTMSGRVARRSPEADAGTRTVHFEIDVADPTRSIPVGTTAALAVGVGEAVPAVLVPLKAAAVREARASLFVVDGTTARKVTATVLGEAQGRLYLDPWAVPAGARVVLEGRGTLKDGDRVAPRAEERADQDATAGDGGRP